MASRSERYGDGRVFLKKRCKNWIAAWCVNGKEIRRSTGTENKSEARKFLRKMLGDKMDGRPVPVARQCTFEDLAKLLRDDYVVNKRRSLDRALLSVAHLRETFGPDRASDITPVRIKAYHSARLAEGAADGTVGIELRALKRMFNLAERLGLLHQVPHIDCPAPSKPRQGFFEEEEFRRVVDQLAEHAKAVAVFAYLTGWRLGEVKGLRWSQVDLNARVVRLEPGTTKNGEGREFPFPAGSELDELLRAQWDATMALQRAEQRTIPWVFHRRGKPLLNFRGAWINACKRAGVPGRLFHDLRRTAVRNLERAGVPRSWAMKLTGHKTESVYRRYAIVSDQDLRDAVDRLTAWQSQESARRRSVR